MLCITSSILATPYISADNNIESFSKNSKSFTEYRGVVIDSKTSKPIAKASIALLDTNIATITNNEGEFLLKIPIDTKSNQVVISHLGYFDMTLSLDYFISEHLEIKLAPSITELDTISISPKDPLVIIKEVLKRKGSNYSNDNTIMTAFYRETIKKRSSYISLSEAVIDIYKTPYKSNKLDHVKLFKARKSADYKKLDTLTLKLQGGPKSTLYIDVMKYPEMLFTQNMTESYQFSFDKTTMLDEKKIYVLNFEQKPHITEPLYYGKLYIDATSLAMTKATFSLNTDNKEEVRKMFVRKKPANAKVQPTKASYTIDYRERDGKWYYGYGNIDLNMKVNWKRKLFNSIYKLNIEIAVTDWKKNDANATLKYRDRLKSSVAISDEASGFSDPMFWGKYNVIEPEKPIETAIKKIKRELEKLN